MIGLVKFSLSLKSSMALERGDTMNYAVKGIDKYYNKAKYDPQPFPIKVGDEVIVIITCKMIQGDPHDLIYSCPFENQCKIDPRYNDGEFEVRTIVQTIFDFSGEGTGVKRLYFCSQ